MGEGSGQVSADSCTDQGAIGWVNADVSVECREVQWESECRSMQRSEGS